MTKSRLQLLIAFGFLVTFALACNLPSSRNSTPVPTATASLTPTATPTMTATPTPIPLSHQVTITSVHSEETGQSPNYKITSDTPEIQNNDDPRVHAFNSLASGIVNDAINQFKASLKYAPATPVSAGSFIDVKYNVVSPPGDVYSLKFDMMGYFDGAAHPYQYSETLTFDIEQGQQLKLADLFLPDSPYLQVIADYCKAELATRDIDFSEFSSGADPTEENYRNWNITADGLLITFDEYQVGPYAAGPQTVLIPYNRLTDIIKPDGPLGRFAP